jgi:hypothetical protein
MAKLENGRGLEQAPPHLDEPTLIDFYRGRLSSGREEAVREHLAACAGCVEAARDARRFLEAMGESAPVREPRRFPAWFPLAAAVLLALAGGVLWLSTRGGGRWRDLPISAAPWPPSAEEELVYRSPEGDGFAEVMEPYARGNYAAAEAALGQYLTSKPHDSRALFYRGVSLLMLGLAREAREPLAAAAELATGSARDEARWYLAIAKLKSGDAARAARDLEDLAKAGGPRRDDAARLLRSIRGGGDAGPNR